MVVVFIEDDAGLRDSIATLLTLHRIGHRCYRHAEEFLDEDPGDGISLLLVDQHLPGMSGTSLIARLRSMGRLPPTVLVTARLTAELRDTALGRGAAGAMQKPLLITDVIRLLAGSGGKTLSQQGSQE